MPKQRENISNLAGVVWTYRNISGSANPKTLSLFPCIAFTHTPSFKLHVHFSLSLYLLWESVCPPSGPLARRFFSFSSVRVMNHTCTHTRKRTLLHLHTRANSPLLKTVNPSFYPHQVTTLVLRSPSFSSPFSLITLSVLAPPSRHSKAKTNGCQSKQATCTQTHAHLARLCSHDLY